MVKLLGGLLGLALGLGLWPMAAAAGGVFTMEVADLPASGLLLVPVPEPLADAAALRATLDGADATRRGRRGYIVRGPRGGRGIG